MLMLYPYEFYPYFRSSYPPHKIINNPLSKIYKKLVDNNQQINFFIHLGNYPFINKDKSNVSYLFDKYPGGVGGNELNKFQYYSGSFRASITLAIYMGFSEIYLVGFDYTHSPARILHWYERGKGIIKIQDDYEKDFIQEVSKYANIITITLDGKSKHLNYKTYRELTGQNPFYRENDQLIINRKYLDILSSYPNTYKIY